MHILNALYRERILYWEPEANLDSSHSYSLLVHSSSTYVIFNQFLGNFGLKLCIFYFMKFNHETGTLNKVQNLKGGIESNVYVSCVQWHPPQIQTVQFPNRACDFFKGAFPRIYTQYALVSLESLLQPAAMPLFKYSPSPFKIVPNHYFFSSPDSIEVLGRSSPPENAPIPGIVPLIESLLCFRQSLLTAMQCFHINQCIMSEALQKSAVTNIPIYSNRIYCNGLCVYDTCTHIYIYIGTYTLWMKFI